MVRINKKEVAALVLLILAASVIEMILPSFLVIMIDTGVAAGEKNVLLIVTAVMIAIAAAGFGVNALAARISAKVSTKFAADLRQTVFDQVQKFSEVEMNRFGTASLITRTTSDVTNVQYFLSLLLRIGIMAPLMAVAGLVLSNATGGELSYVLTAAMPLLILLSCIIVVFSTRYSKKLRQKTDTLNRLFLETLEGVRVIRAFNRQKYAAGRFRKANKDYTETTVWSGSVSGLLYPAIELIFGLSAAAVMAIGSYYISIGELKVGALIANTQYISVILAAAVLLAAVVMLYPMAHACASRIAEVLKTEPVVRDGEKTLQDKHLSGLVELRNVSFSYPGAQEPVVENISFASRPGEVTAITGRTGCGKSTILKLLPRLYDAVSGHILIDGIEVKNYKLRDLRQLIGYVPQKSVLFSGDIGMNLNFGKENGTAEDWKKAADTACSSGFIETRENSWHAEIEQGGVNLSGGQRQRMAVARAVMKNPEIYLFDDCFSALDVKTEQKVRSNLRRLVGNATVIMTSQRISSIIDADRILFIENGKVIGNGTHQELLKTCPMYREMAELQMGKAALENEG